MYKKIISVCILSVLFLGFSGVVGAEYEYSGHQYQGVDIQPVYGKGAIYVNGEWQFVPDGAQISDPIGEFTTYTAPSVQSRAPEDFSDLIGAFLGLIDLLIPTVFALALLFFFWGLAQFIWAAGRGNEEKIKAGKQLMFWGVIALFIMFSIYGIIWMLGQDLGVSFPVRLLDVN